MTRGPHAALRSRIQELKHELVSLRQQLGIGHGLEAREAFDVLVCRVGTKKVAILKSELERVVLAAFLTELPGAPEWAAGVLNRGGSLVPVVDLVARLEHRHHRLALSDAIVICSLGEKRLGLVVEETLELATIYPGLLRPVTDDAGEAPFVIGIVPEEDGLILVLSAEALLDQLEVAVG